MEENQERSLVLRPSHELITTQRVRSHILGSMVEGLLALSKESGLEKIDLNELVRQAKLCQDLCFSFGGPPEKTPENIQAFSLLHKAAGAGHPEAQYLVSHCYHFGIGVDKDLVKTLEWLVRSAEAGFSRAQTSLGACYEYRCLVPYDSVAAMNWYQKAADQNDGRAQHYLGRLYLEGKDSVKKDLIQAYKWLKLGGEQGHEIFYDEALILAAPLMTPSEIETANGLYMEFNERLRNQERKANP